MTTVFIVLPILTLLMFDLGLTLELGDFRRILHRPRPVLAGMLGQLLVLPLIAFMLASLFCLPPYFQIGIVLIACCPGGSSSNVFSLLAKGDVALSVTLTVLSSLITLFTIPFILKITMTMMGEMGEATIHLPVGNLLLQNLLLMLLPILLGVGVRHWFARAAVKLEKWLSKIAFPALILLATVFFIQHRTTIASNIGILGLSVTLLIILAIGVGGLICRAMKLKGKERRTIVIEIGMQNAAQAIAIASSPFIFANDVIAIPAIIYALMMNVILLTYVGVVKRKMLA